MAIIAIFAVILGWAALLALEIATYSGVRDGQRAAAAIVLGAGIAGDEPSPVFAARIDHAVELYRAGRVGRVVFTGGAGPGGRRAESEVAREYAVRRGVRRSDTACETASRVTCANLVEARRLLADPGERVLVVSDPLHLRRAITMARDLGLDAHPEPTPYSRYRSWHSRGTFLCRETFFYAQYLIGRPFGRRE